MNRYLKILVTSFTLTSLWASVTPALAQEMTREDRLQTLERLRQEDAKLEAQSATLDQTLADVLNVKLPPLSVFLEAVTENAAVKRAKSEVDEVRNEYRLQKRDWMNYMRIQGMYSYGRYNVISNNSDEFTPMYQTSMTNAQHNFNVGMSVSIGIGDIINRGLKLKKYRYDIEQLQFTQDEIMEERRLRVLEAYNAVTEQLATISAKAETAALYNAQMKITEYNFIQGKLDIISLGVERGRRTGAVTNYEQSRVALHNSIILLEMLTNVKIIKDK